MTHLSTEYHQYIQSEAWNQKRLERLRLDAYTCQDCNANDKPLDVHHITYDNFGDEFMSDLVSVCRQCHDERHGKQSFFFDICPTCKQLIQIATQRVKILGALWNDFVCADGHFWSKRI